MPCRLLSSGLGAAVVAALASGTCRSGPSRKAAIRKRRERRLAACNIGHLHSLPFSISRVDGAGQRKPPYLTFRLVEEVLAVGAAGRHSQQMDGIVSLAAVREDRFWAVVACVGRTRRIAEIFTSRDAALADRAWREQQVRAYESFLRSSRHPPPNYSVEQMRRADIPKTW